MITVTSTKSFYFPSMKVMVQLSSLVAYHERIPEYVKNSVMGNDTAPSFL